jgi:mono/diheme cytochrome c family protein
VGFHTIFVCEKSARSRGNGFSTLRSQRYGACSVAADWEVSTMRHWGWLVGLALLLSACPKKDDGKKPGEGEGEGEVAANMRRIDAAPDKVAKGKAAFGACVGCHGEDASGRIGIGPRLVSDSFLAAASDDFLVENIKNGRVGTTMVAWGGSYNDEQIESIVAYIRSLNPVAAATLDEKPLAGKPDKGAEWFRNVCSGCHGRSGGGYQETSNGTGIGRKAFLDKASNGFLRHIIHEGKTHTAMRGFGGDDPMAVANLDDQAIDDIIAHLRANAW